MKTRIKNFRFKPTLAVSLAIAGSIQYAAAQNEGDALRFSMLEPQGTARSIGFGSALGSVGGDFTSLSVNPAGIGIYRKSEFVFTPSLMLNNSTGNYADGGDRTASGAHFSISNIGFIFTQAEKGRRYEKSKWKAVSFGIGLNRMADFTRDYTYHGNNSTSSGSYVFESDANSPTGNVNDPYMASPAYLGYQSFLLDTATLANGSSGFKSVVDPTAANPVSQTKIMSERGGISELVLSLGGNYAEKLMLGATIGVPILRYTQDQRFIETQANNPAFQSFSYDQHLTTHGTGFNAKLGAIYKVNDIVRFGAAIHTPTWYTMSDVQDLSVTANTTEGNGIVTVPAALNEYDYSIRTPWRAVASGTVMLGTHGFFTVDYEYVNYASARFHFPTKDLDYQSALATSQYQDLINSAIQSNFTHASNIRAGLEIRLDQVLLRGGFGYYGNPYKSGADSLYGNGQRIDLSAGIGYRFSHYFLDLGYVHHQYKSQETPYDPGYSNITVPTAMLNTGQNNVALTFGIKF